MKAQIMAAALLLIGCAQSHDVPRCAAPRGKWEVRRASDQPSCKTILYTVDLDHENAADGCTAAADFDTGACILTTRGRCSASTFVTVLRFNEDATQLMEGTETVEAATLCDYELTGGRVNDD